MLRGTVASIERMRALTRTGQAQAAQILDHLR
jgi:hypothetical protein